MLDGKNIYDISPVIGGSTAVFPGDVPFKRNISLSFENNNHLTLSSLTTTVHIGAHVDAPIHYHKNGVSIDKRELSYYMGNCQVIEVNLDRAKRITPLDIKQKIKAPRVLFKTNSFPDPNSWNDDFNSLSKELIQYLADKNVILAGIDTPSIDPFDDKELLSHNEIYKNDMAILEGIVLSEVQEGLYNLIALPLKIENADASPVRAILIERANDD